MDPSQYQQAIVMLTQRALAAGMPKGVAVAVLETTKLDLYMNMREENETRIVRPNGDIPPGARG